MARVSRDTLLMQVALLMAERSTCDRAHVGCVIAKDGRIISSGYNGAPSRMPHCTDVGCDIDPQTGSCLRTSHAEAGALAFAAKAGVSVNGATAYVTHYPCLTCAKNLINAGIVRVVFLKDYGSVGLMFATSDLFKATGVELKQYADGQGES